MNALLLLTLRHLVLLFSRSRLGIMRGGGVGVRWVPSSGDGLESRSSLAPLLAMFESEEVVHPAKRTLDASGLEPFAHVSQLIEPAHRF